MGWYDWFSRIYDRSLQRLYADAQAAAADALDLSAGHCVLDVPCGTGQSFSHVRPRIAPAGRLVGVDVSAGMLARAQARLAAGDDDVRLVHADVQTLDTATLADASDGRPIDRILVFLGMTAFPDPDAAFARLWRVLRAGGRMAIVDVYAERPGLQGRMVNLVARADIRRRAWQPLQRVGEGYERRDLPSLPKHGGQLWLATAIKP